MTLLEYNIIGKRENRSKVKTRNRTQLRLVVHHHNKVTPHKYRKVIEIVRESE